MCLVHQDFVKGLCPLRSAHTLYQNTSYKGLDYNLVFYIYIFVIFEIGKYIYFVTFLFIYTECLQDFCGFCTLFYFCEC